jgi:hypothetical protein
VIPFTQKLKNCESNLDIDNILWEFQLIAQKAKSNTRQITQDSEKGEKGAAGEKEGRERKVDADHFSWVGRRAKSSPRRKTGTSGGTENGGGKRQKKTTWKENGDRSLRPINRKFPI